MNKEIVDGFFTGLYDVDGNMIKVGDRLLFLKCPADNRDFYGLWKANVVFADGVFTIDDYKGVEQVRNPKDWKYGHNWVESRGWAVTVGYGEYGTWNVYRKPLTEIQTGFGRSQEHFEKYYRPLAEKIGWSKRFINVRVVNK